MRCLGCVVLLWLGFGLTVPLSVSASQAAVHRVQGQVVAVNLKETPPIIVVTTRLAQQEMIVGATVGFGASITRGTRRITLDALKVGESVTIVYRKDPSGLVAQSILAK
ncbi:MAG: hypothetical protein ACT4OO_08905 [Nitrospiraceae bacterium]